MNAYRKRRREKVKTMRDNGMGEYVALQWKDYRTTFPWEERPPGVPKTTTESPRR
jgi:hypothetical protein